MFSISIPGHDPFKLKHLVLDYNGTLACDGLLIAGVAERLELLSHQLSIDVITADTHGNAAEQLKSLPVEVIVIPPRNQSQAKHDHIVKRGHRAVVAIGNGFNDHLMLNKAVLGIAVSYLEGAAVRSVIAADIVVPNILAALDLLLKPQRLIASLRD